MSFNVWRITEMGTKNDIKTQWIQFDSHFVCSAFFACLCRSCFWHFFTFSLSSLFSTSSIGQTEAADWNGFSCCDGNDDDEISKHLNNGFIFLAETKKKTRDRMKTLVFVSVGVSWEYSDAEHLFVEFNYEGFCVCLLSDHCSVTHIVCHSNRNKWHQPNCQTLQLNQFNFTYSFHSLCAIRSSQMKLCQFIVRI